MSNRIKNFKKIRLQGFSKNPKQGQSWLHNQQVNFKNHKGNLGIPCGKVNDIIGFDPDYYKWNENHPFYQFMGHNDMMKLVQEYNTYTVKTPSGGLHFYFKYNGLPQINSDIDIDIKSNNGYLVGEGSKIPGKGYYECINDVDIKEMPKPLYDWLYSNLNYKHNTKKTISKKTTANKTLNNSDKSVYQYNFTDQEIIQILNNLPESYITKHDNWLKTATAMKTINKVDLFLEFCANHKNTKGGINRKGDAEYNKRIQLINGITQHHDLLMINHILLQSNSRTMLDYNKMKPIYGKQFETDNQININRTKLGKLDNSKDDKGFVDIISNKNYVIKSDTGTGKTTLFKKYTKKNKSPIVSIVSRISLGNAQYEEFSKAQIKISNYLSTCDYFIKDGDSIIITIDSIQRLINLDFSNYIIFLDEFNSMLEYLWTCPNLNDKRVLCVKFLIKIIQECKQFICVDADISYVCKLFLKFCGVEYDYIVNEYKHNKNVPAKEIFDYENFINLIDSCINKTGCLIPCDSKLSAETIYERITEGYDTENNHEQENYNSCVRYVNDISIALITSETDEYLPLDDYDVVVFSPKIVYGLDSVRKRPVFAHYKEHTISPKSMLQQIARNRNITKLYYIFYKKKFHECNYNKLLDVAYDIKDQQKLIAFKMLCNTDENTLFNHILTIIRFNEDAQNTNKFAHFKNLLKQRGFIDDTEYFQTKIKNLSVAEKELKEKKELNFNPKDGKWDKVKEMLNLHEDADVMEYKDMFLNIGHLQNHFNFNKFFFRDSDYWSSRLEKQNEYNVIKSTATYNKCLFIKEITNKAQMINKLDIMSCKALDKNTADYVIEKYKTMFRDRTKKDIDLTTNQGIQGFVSKLYKKMFGAGIVEKKRIMNEGIRTNDYTISDTEFNLHYKLTQYKTELKKDLVLKSDVWNYGNEKQLFQEIIIDFTLED